MYSIVLNIFTNNTFLIALIIVSSLTSQDPDTNLMKVDESNYSSQFYTPPSVWQDRYSYTLTELHPNRTYEGHLCPSNKYGDGECAMFAFKTASR